MFVKETIRTKENLGETPLGILQHVIVCRVDGEDVSFLLASTALSDPESS